jgi:carbon storage regulator
MESHMLVLSRTKDQMVMIGDDIGIMVIEIQKNKVRLGISAPRDVPVHRHEIWLEIKEKARKATTGGDAG